MSRKGKTPVAKIPVKPPTAAQKRAAAKKDAERKAKMAAAGLGDPQNVPAPPPNYLLTLKGIDGKEGKKILVGDQVKQFIEMFASSELDEDLNRIWILNHMKFTMVVEPAPIPQQGPPPPPPKK